MKIRVREFWTFEGEDETLDTMINKWLEMNDVLEIIDIKYSISATDETSASGALILYKVV